MSMMQSSIPLRTVLLLLMVIVIHANVQETLIGITGKDFVLLGADSSLSGSGSISWTSHSVDKIHVLHGGKTAAAVGGDMADSERFIEVLHAHGAIREWEQDMGSDVEYILDDGTIHKHSCGFGLSVDAIAHLARFQISQSLRTRNRLNVCLLIAGMVDSSTDAAAVAGEGQRHFSKRLQHQVNAARNNPDLEIISEIKSQGQQQQQQQQQRHHKLHCQVPRLFWLDQYGSLQTLSYGAHGFAANFLLSILDQGYRPDMTLEEATALMKTCFDQLRVRYIIDSPKPPCMKCITIHGCRKIE